MELDEHGNPIVKALTAEEIQAQVDAKVAEALKDIKENLNKAYSARDAANAKAAELETARKNAEMEALKLAGKHEEAAAMQVAQLKAELDDARAKITGYTRDTVVREAMRGLEFRNDRSSAMAYRDVVDQLVQNDQGEWVHKTGVTIKDFVTSFAKAEDNEFLFKPKTNSGSGASGPNGPTPTLDPKRKLSELSGADVLALAAAGKLPFKH